jgi:hypothetical protein
MLTIWSQIMNALGDWRYVTPEDLSTFHGEKNRRKAMSSSGWIGQTWLTNYSINARVPYTDSFPLPGGFAPARNQISFAAKDLFASAAAHFVHGGSKPPPATSLSTTAANHTRIKVTPVWATKTEDPVENINTVGLSLVKRAEDNLLNPTHHHLPPGTTKEEAEFYSADGKSFSHSFFILKVC